MKKNMLMRPSSWLGILLSLSSLWHVSCDSCHAGQLDRDKDLVIAVIDMDTPTITADINGKPVVLVDAKITEKHITKTSKLCLLLIPKGKKEVKEAIGTFQKSKKKLGKGDQEVSYIPLSATSNEGAVYYVKELPGPDQGKVNGSVLVKDLPAGPYVAYLILHTEGYGTVFSNEQDLNILPPPDKTVDPFVTMVDDALAERDRTSPDVALLITTNAAAQNLKGREKGWFLFIDKKDTAIDAETAIADFLKSGNDILPDKLEFTPLGKALVHPLPNVVVGNNQLKAQAKNNILKRGATYNVYACLLYTDKEGNQRYVVSEAVEMLIPKPVVKLEIKEVKIAALIRCLDDPNVVHNTDSLSIKYVAEITKEEGTTKPQIGLLFVKGGQVNSQAGIQKIQNLLTKGPKNGYYQDGGDLVYLIGPDTTKLQDTITTSFIPLELGAGYHVYFFLVDEDGKGEVFLSENEVALTVPNASLRAYGFKTSRLSTKTGIEWKSLASDISEYAGDAGKRGSGFILLEDGKTLETSFLKEILDNANADRSEDPLKIPKYSSQIGGASCNFVDVKNDDTFNLEACLSVYSGLDDKKTIQHVCQVVFGEHEVFWKTLAGEKMTFYPTDKPDRESMPINQKLWQAKPSYVPNSKYRYLKFDEKDPDAKIVLFKVDDANKNNEVEFPYDLAKDALFRDLLGCIIDGDDPQEVKDKIDSFIKKMKNP